MSRDQLTLYPDHPRGSLSGNVVGSIVRGMHDFDIIRPGYDAQGRRRLQWTQFVHDGVPIFEMKVRVDLGKAIRRFDALWNQHIGGDQDLLDQALFAARRERISRFRDGVSGQAPAPTLVKDGRPDGHRYPT